MRVLRRALQSLALLLVLATFAIGLLHTGAGHPLLMKLAGAAGCPLGRANPAQVEAVRRAAVANERGTEPAPSRPALGFELDRTRLDDLRAWEERVGASCTESREGTLVQCADLPADALGRPSWEGRLAELTFGLSPEGRLVTVTTLYSHRDADDGARIAADVEAALARSLGAPHKSAGSLSEPGTTATLSYRFRDYAADETASRVPGSGCVVRELYASMR